jgi:hypothetical protein
VRCPPYESAYGEAPQMAGKSAELADLAGFYAAFGLAPAASQPDMEDHVKVDFCEARAPRRPAGGLCRRPPMCGRC